MSNGIDQPLYFVECDFGKIGKAFVEIDRDRNSRREVIENIRSGEWRDVVTVLEVNPVERTSRDVTDDILQEASQEADPTFNRPNENDRLWAKWDHDRGLRV